MPYAIVPEIPVPVQRHPRITTTWLGFDVEAGWNGVRLSRTRALVWHPTVTLTDPRAIVLADDGLDVLSAARRTRIAALHPDRTFKAGTRLRDAIADLLRRPVPGGFPALLPHRAGRYEILCGPGAVGANRLWEEATEPDGPHSQDIQDNFNRSNGNVAGSTSSDSQFTWSLAQGTGSTIQIASNQLKSLRAGSDAYNVLVPSLNMDTVNHYGQIDLVSKTESGSDWAVSSEIAVRIRNGDGAGGDEGYAFNVFRNTAGFDRNVYDWVGSPLPGATDTTNTTSGTMYLEFNGSSYVAKINGATIFSGTDAAYSTYKKVAIAHYVAASDNPNVIVDNYRAADLSAGAAVPVFMNQYRQRRRS